MKGAGGTGEAIIYINVSKGCSGSLGLIGSFDLETLSCPLDPLILSIVSRNRPVSPFDSVSKSTLGPHPPPIVPTWPDLGPDSAHFAKFCWPNVWIRGSSNMTQSRNFLIAFLNSVTQLRLRNCFFLTNAPKKLKQNCLVANILFS